MIATDAYSRTRRQEARNLLRVANAAVQVAEPRPWEYRPDPRLVARIERVQAARLARLEGRATAIEPTSIVMRVDPDVAVLLEERRRDGESKAAGHSRIIREALAELAQRDAYIAGLEAELGIAN